MLIKKAPDGSGLVLPTVLSIIIAQVEKKTSESSVLVTSTVPNTKLEKLRMRYLVLVT